MEGEKYEGGSFTELSKKLSKLPIQKPRSEFSEMLDKVYEDRPEIKTLKDEIRAILNQDDFDQEYATRKVTIWNNAEEGRGKLGGNFWSIPGIRCKHGTLKIYFYPEKQGFKLILSPNS